MSWDPIKGLEGKFEETQKDEQDRGAEQTFPPFLVFLSISAML